MAGYRYGRRIDNAFANTLFGRSGVERGTKKAVKKIRTHVQKRKTTKLMKRKP